MHVYLDLIVLIITLRTITGRYDDELKLTQQLIC